MTKRYSPIQTEAIQGKSRQQGYADRFPKDTSMPAPKPITKALNNELDESWRIKGKNIIEKTGRALANPTEKRDVTNTIDSRKNRTIATNK